MIKTIKTMSKQEKERYTVPRKVQDVIPVRRIWPDGIFLVGNKFSKTYKFSDINYLVASREDMFADLCKYESEDFYQEHKTIRFDTLDSFGEYEVIAAFKTVAYSEEGFKYYHFVNAESAEAFDEYIAQCKALALYDTGVTAEYGDQLITLSTCEYSRTNGRMVVVAKKIEA